MEDGRIIQLYYERKEQAIAESDRKYGKLCRRIAGNILGVRLLPQKENGLVGFLLFREKSAKLCGISDTYRKNSLRIGIESSCMTDFFLF